MELILLVVRRFLYLAISAYMIFNITPYRYNYIDTSITITYKSPIYSLDTINYSF
jgi:hypothetical protein